MDEKRRKIRNKYTQLLLKSKKISEGYESSWSTHCRMFGDLLEPAFADDEASRLELVGALNMISRGKYTAAAKKLDRLLDACRSDADFAAVNFFTGVCWDKAGIIDMAIVYYGEAAKREPEFYMVYLCWQSVCTQSIITRPHPARMSRRLTRSSHVLKKTRCRPSERSRFSARCTAILQAAL